MDEELREALVALGMRTAGPLAALAAEDVERRWGEVGLAAWRLARGEDPRRPVLARLDAPRAVTAELTPSVETMEPVLFLVRAALERLTRELVADGRAAAVVAITLALDDARGAAHGVAWDAPAAPGGAGHARDERTHTVTREVRLPRPLARAVPLLERCRALLERWTLTAPVSAVTVAVTATAPLAGEQGELLDPAWRDPAAADAAFARLRAELGPQAIVRPVSRDEHRPERAGEWKEVEVDELPGAHGDEKNGGGNGKGRGAPPEKQNTTRTPDLRHHGIAPRTRSLRDGEGPGGAGHATTPASLPPLRLVSTDDRDDPPAAAPALRQLERPEPAEVECAGEVPRALWWRGRRIAVAHALGPERLAGDWWKDPYARDYWRCEAEEGVGHLVLFREKNVTAEERWYVHGWYD
jgi:nucleotidyltransferase/DNA polymerase involved in DNA repair